MNATLKGEEVWKQLFEEGGTDLFNGVYIEEYHPDRTYKPSHLVIAEDQEDPLYFYIYICQIECKGIDPGKYTQKVLTPGEGVVLYYDYSKNTPS